jgi:hypothetical protein
LVLWLELFNEALELFLSVAWCNMSSFRASFHGIPILLVAIDEPPYQRSGSPAASRVRSARGERSQAYVYPAATWSTRDLLRRRLRLVRQRGQL